GSLDDLVNDSEQRWRHGEAERLGGLEIDHQLVFRRCLHRKIGGFLAIQNAMNVACSLSPLARQIRTIGDQATLEHGYPKKINRWYFVFRRQRHNQFPM